MLPDEVWHEARVLVEQCQHGQQRRVVLAAHEVATRVPARACQRPCCCLCVAGSLPRRAQTYLEQNGGPGLQHLALKTDNIFATLREMRARTDQGGFDFMPRASLDYYRCVE